MATTITATDANGVVGSRSYTINRIVAPGPSWADKTPAGENRSWGNVAVSNNGQTIIAGGSSNGLTSGYGAFRSTNGGTSWASIPTLTGMSHITQHCAATADLSTILIAGGFVMRSTDSGVSFAQAATLGGLSLGYLAALSGDATKAMVMGLTSSGTYAIVRSTNGGINFSSSFSPVARLDSLVMSDNGMVAVTGANNGTQPISITTNGGVSWTSITEFSNTATLLDAIVNATGTYIGLYVNDGAGSEFAYSSNSGVSWTRVATTKNVGLRLGQSANGQIIVTSHASATPTATSVNRGATLTTRTTGGTGLIHGAAVSKNGLHMLVGDTRTANGGTGKLFMSSGS